MMVSNERHEALENLATFVRTCDPTITNALQVYARKMREAAVEARQSWLVATDSPQPASPGNVSIAVTKNGYATMAKQFEQSAEAAERAVAEIAKHLDTLMDVE